MLSYPEISPVAVSLGPITIRWYALAYVSGIWLGQRLLSWLNTRHHPRFFSAEALDALITYAVLGVVLGGRLGAVLFYHLDYYLAHPLDILKIWQGGMSFHGGLIGVLTAFYLFARRYRLPWLAIMDRLAIATPIGLFFGRLANFVNGELYGRISDAPWAMVFPRGGPLPRHPSQLYEAGMEGLLLFTLLLSVALRSDWLQRRGAIGGLFLMGYATTRITAECFREPDVQLGYLIGGLTMGQILSLPMWLAGAWLLRRALHRPPSADGVDHAH